MISILVLIALTAPWADGVLVETATLASAKRVLIVDARAKADFESGHIPGALHIDPATLSETRGGVRGILKSEGEVSRLLAEAGIQPSVPIVVYAAMEAPDDLKSATRLFWILEYMGYREVAVLDGGLAKWAAEGRPLAKGATTPLPVPVTTSVPRRSLLATHSQVRRLIEEENGVLLDNRGAGSYAGESKKDYVARAGHIAGAVNVPAVDFVAEDGVSFRSKEQLTEILGGHGIASDTPVITYCNSGRSATMGYFVGRLIGLKEVRLYDGAMAEWTSIEDAPVETMPVPKETEGS
jgi:thiosulfate/3-mercaptopyruvate sulfurtransferase